MEDHSCCSQPTHEPSPDHCAPKPWYRGQVFLSLVGVILVVGLTFVVGVLSPFRQALWMYARLVTGYFLLGILIGGIISALVPQEMITRWLAGSRKRTIIRSVFLGFLMSACSHGIMAIAMALYKKGASVPSVISFLLASPWANMAVTVLLVGLFGWQGVLIIVLAMVLAIVTGLVFLRLQRLDWIPGRVLSPSPQPPPIQGGGRGGDSHRLKDVPRAVLRGSWELLEMTLGWVTLGVAMAALIATFVPPDFFFRWMGPTPMGLAVTMGGATVIEVCSEGSAPLAFEIYRQTAALGNVFVFLMAGVATDYTELGLIGSNMGWRVAGWLIAVNLPMIFLFGILLNDAL